MLRLGGGRVWLRGGPGGVPLRVALQRLPRITACWDGGDLIVTTIR